MLVPHAVSAEVVEGSGALALSALVGGVSPLLKEEEKAALTKLLNGQANVNFPADKTISVTARRLNCRASNIDIKAHSCDLTFGKHEVSLTGRSAHELFATLAEIGIAPDGAAGSIIRAVSNLECTIDPNEVTKNSGGGAHCQYGPPQAPTNEKPGLVIRGNTIKGTRDARYCEIIPIVRHGVHLTATVYNTLGLNDCPASVWINITEDAMKAHFGAVTVLLNGPRYFIMDSITAGGATASGKKIEVGGLELTERASVDLGLFDLLHRPYRETTINRDTRYLFKAGLPVFMLEAPDGSRYIMQAYAQIVDKALSYADLPELAHRLQLPEGWRYTTTVPDEDIVVGAKGKATVVQDDLENTYQKLD